MPRGRGIYRDEPRDKLEQNKDAVESDEGDRVADGDGDESPEPVEPPD